MANEVLNTEPQSSMKFDELGVLEINDPNLLAVVAAGVNSPYFNGFCSTDGVCGGDSTCIGDEYCSGNPYCINR